MPVAMNAGPNLNTIMKNALARVTKCLTTSSAGSALDTTRASLITISPVLERPPPTLLAGPLTQATCHSSAGTYTETDPCFSALNERCPLCVVFSKAWQSEARSEVVNRKKPLRCHWQRGSLRLVCFETHSRSSINAVAEISLSLFFVRSHVDSAAPETTEQVKLPAGPLCSVAG